jgi:phosphate transport system substrate-binding protein
VRYRPLLAAVAAGSLALGAAACGNSDDNGSSGSGGQNLSGKITIDGSSTVYPFAQAAAEEFQTENPGVKVTVGESGTGGGFEKFCNGETDISDASRPIKADEEAPICKKKGVSYSQVQIANDGIAVTTNKDLKIDCMTVDQLKALWNSESKAKKYSDVDPKFPGDKVSLYGPGTDSGTFDFFTEEINGEKGDTRKDYQPSEDDNVLVQGVSGDKNGLGYFGFSYYEQNQDRLNLVGIDSGSGCTKPDKADIQNGSYKPLGRPLFMYPAAKSIRRPEVKAFMDFILANYQGIADNAKIIAMTPKQADQAKQDLASAES